MALLGTRALARLSHLSSQCLDKRVSLAWNIARVSAQQTSSLGGHEAICAARPTFNVSLPSRLYATNAVSRPKAHTGRTTSAPRKKASTTTKAPTAGAQGRPKKPAAEKATAKAPKPRTTKASTSKAKPKTKSKPRTRAKSTKARKKPAKAKKRRLTPEQVEKKAKQKNRQAIKDLKVKALTPPKKLPSTAYVVFIAERTQKGGAAAGPSAIKECARIYKSFSPEEREHYNHIANQNKATNQARYREWIRSFTPTQIYEANNARLSLKKKKISGSWTKLEDERLAKRARNNYSYFVKDRFKSGDFAGMGLAEAAKLMGGEWRALSANEKQAYSRRAEEDMARYDQEVKAVYNRDVKHNAAKAAAA
ncbi:MAG: hypothetical protein Q9208_001115 [Pyrenodesmia sp. 3 TL-2023]